MFQSVLVPEKTLASANGDSPAVELGASAGQIFLLTLTITNVIEQESLELSIFASADGATWSPKPLASFPHKFYRGEYPFLLDLTSHPNLKFIRAHWDVARWGRGAETPMFEFGVSLREIPADMLRDVAVSSRMSA